MWQKIEDWFIAQSMPRKIILGMVCVFVLVIIASWIF